MATAHALGGARPLVVDEHVGTIEQRVECRAVALGLEVEHDAPLAAIQPHEVGAEAVDGRVVGAREITRAGSFDLDDVRAKVGQMPRG